VGLLVVQRAHVGRFFELFKELSVPVLFKIFKNQRIVGFDSLKLKLK
jgi:hypothetical protein